MKTDSMIKRILRFLAFVFSFFLLALYTILPMRLRLLYLRIFCSIATKIKPVFDLRLPPVVKKTPLEDQANANPKEDACVHFSGGSDSTLVASYLAEKYRKVHPLTFHHCTISSLDHCTYNTANLKKKYGNDKFVFKIIDIDRLFRRMYLGRQFRDFSRFFLFTQLPCGTCRFAMHIRTIVYCIENGIKYVSDGSNQYYQMAAPAEMPSVLNLIKDLYSSYGIHYVVNPAYNKEDADNELYERGIVPQKDLRSNWNTYKKTQPVCNCGLFFLIMYKTYWVYYHGVEKWSHTAFRYHQEKIQWYKELIKEELASKNISQDTS